MKRTFLTLLMALSIGISTWADEATWHYGQSIETEEGYSYHELIIDEKVYPESHPMLNDIRVIDGNEAFVPYFFKESEPEVVEAGDFLTLDLVRNYTHYDDTIFDFRAGDSSAQKAYLTNGLTVEVYGSDDFFQYVDVYGSMDQETWDYIGNDSIYRVEGVEDWTLDFPEDETYSYYRMVLLDDLHKVDVTRVVATHTVTQWQHKDTLNTLEGVAYTRTEKGTQTILTLKGYGNLPLNRIRINAEGMYRRVVEVQFLNAQGDVRMFDRDLFYQSSLNQTNVKKDITLYRTTGYQDIIIKIENNDDVPLVINSIALIAQFDRIIFPTKDGESYQLLYGNATASAPQYDLGSFKDDIKTAQLQLATLNPEVHSLDWIPPAKRTDTKTGWGQGFSSRNMFDLVVVGIALILGIVAVSKMSKKNS